MNSITENLTGNYILDPENIEKKTIHRHILYNVYFYETGRGPKYKYFYFNEKIIKINKKL